MLENEMLSASLGVDDGSTVVSETWEAVETSEGEMPETISLTAFEDAEGPPKALDSKLDPMMVAEAGELLGP